MQQYFVHIELEAASPSDYLRLNQEMANRGFLKTIVSDTGERFILPNGTYRIHSVSGKVSVMTGAKAAASSTGKVNYILVIIDGGFQFQLKKPEY